MRIIHLFLVVLSLMVAAQGCGLKGPLRQPDRATPVKPAPPQPVEK